jgi:hypothetical protein
LKTKLRKSSLPFSIQKLRWCKKRRRYSMS